MSKTTLPRHELLERAAKTRAILIAFMNRQLEPLSIKHITERVSDELYDAGIDATAVNYQLQMLAENKLIGVTKEGVQLMYFGKNGSGQELSVLKKPQKTKKDDILPTQVSVEFVKSTGKIRFLLDGVIIEIGVVK